MRLTKYNSLVWYVVFHADMPTAPPPFCASPRYPVEARGPARAQCAVPRELKWPEMAEGEVVANPRTVAEAFTNCIVEGLSSSSIMPRCTKSSQLLEVRLNKYVIEGTTVVVRTSMGLTLRNDIGNQTKCKRSIFGVRRWRSQNDLPIMALQSQ